jgi:hypothetical protein
MNKFRLALTALAIMAFTLTVSMSSQAQATRTWVSGVGDDVNPCSRTAPCKTFAGAITKTAKDGEINALDPGGFGAVSIFKSITIDGTPTGSAGIFHAQGSTGVTINISDPADVRKSVTLRGLAINGGGSGGRGVRILAAAKVYVENCSIWGQNGSPGTGIEDIRTTGGFLEVDNTTVTNNTGNAISVAPSSGSVQLSAHVANSRLQGNGNTGLVLGSNVKATIYNSVVTQHSGTGGGFFLSNTAGGSTELSVDQCVVSNNNVGFIASSANTTIRVSNTTAMNNTTLATVAGGGLVSSYSPASNQTGGVAFPSASTAKQ